MRLERVVRQAMAFLGLPCTRISLPRSLLLPSPPPLHTGLCVVRSLQRDRWGGGGANAGERLPPRAMPLGTAAQSRGRGDDGSGLLVGVPGLVFALTGPAYLIIPTVLKQGVCPCGCGGECARAAISHSQCLQGIHHPRVPPALGSCAVPQNQHQNGWWH